MATHPEQCNGPVGNPSASRPTNILAIDIGGSKVKFLVSGQTEPRRVPSGPEMTPGRMVEAVHAAADPWEYDAVSIGFPGQVGDSGPRSEPGHLGEGWVGFNYAAAFGRPVRIINDAAMQALGSYDGGRMLFLGLGTGLGSTLISENVIVPLELGRLQLRGRELLGTVLGRRSLKRLGKAAWCRAVTRAASSLMAAFLADYVVLGGGNAKMLGSNLPPGMRRGNNLTAFRGGFRLWGLQDVRTLTAEPPPLDPVTPPTAEWRLI